MIAARWALLGVTLLGCQPEPAFDWALPPGFPTPAVPDDNPMSVAKVELGRQLFYDVRLSGNQTQSCGSCHFQHLAFTDGVAQPIGSTGEVVRRNSMSLANVGYFSALTWASQLLNDLESQAMIPLFGEHPTELGLAGREQEAFDRLAADDATRRLFDDAFPGAPIDTRSVTAALAAFQRTLISGDAPYDRHLNNGGDPAFGDAEQRGLALFFSERTECFHCHGGFLFADSVRHEGTVFDEQMFHNTGLYNVDGAGAYPLSDQGLYEQTLRPGDMGRFRAPSLRNIALTAPYMHDGSIATLDEVLDHYAAGGRTISDGPNAGIGSENPYKSEFMVGFTLTPDERADLLAFLHSLTDETFVTDPRFSDPFAP